MAATIGQKHKNGFKIVEIWDNLSQSLENNLYNDFKGPEHLLGGMNLENEIDTCQTTVHCLPALKDQCVLGVVIFCDIQIANPHDIHSNAGCHLKTL